LRVSDNLSAPSININRNEFSVPNRAKEENSTYKEAFKLDINPRYLDPNAENEVQLMNTDDLYYLKSLEVVSKP
jgi:hypothetical protein